MKCTNCGASLSDSAKFCPECGTKVVREVFCAQCGTKLSAGTKFCPECGTKVGGSAASAPKAAKESYPKDNGSSKWLTIEDGVLTDCDDKAEGEVIIPEGVTEIGDCAFGYCEKITEIVIPASVTEIYSSSFEGDEKCTALCAITVAGGNKKYKSVDGVLYSKDGKTLLFYPSGKDDEEFTVPDGVKTIDSFGANESLVSIKLPDSLEEIGDYAFDGCEARESIKIPDGVETIGDGVFSGCKALESITLPDSLEKIGDNAFDGCKALESITLPDSLEKIGDDAFCDCEALESIKIPASVTEISYGAFYNCKALCSITVARGNEEYKSVDGVLYSDGGKTLFIYPEGKDDEEFTVPAGVKEIGDSAFSDCNALESITLPDSLEKIGGFAFRDCEALESIKIPESVTEIASRAFSGCEALCVIAVARGNEEYKSVDGVLYSDGGKTLFIYPDGKDDEEFTVPAGVKKIEDFCANESLVSVKLPDGLKEIGDSAFEECNALESITLPASVTKIGEDALSCCESLKQVRYEGTTDEWEEVEQGEGWLYGTQVKKVRCSDGFGKLSEDAFGDDDEDDEDDTNDSEDDEIDTSDSDDWDEEEEEGDEAD